MKLLIDEMYSPELAERLRELGHGVIAAQERVDLPAAPDTEIVERMQAEGRVIVTNNHRDFVPLANSRLHAGDRFHGLVLTADSSLPRNKRTIPVMVGLLAALLDKHREEEVLPVGIEWLTTT